MIDKNKDYHLSELLDDFGMLNIEFQFYGNNDKGNLVLYMKTDSDKVSVFVSTKNQTKNEYLKLDEETAKDTPFRFSHEVNELELDIAVIVLRTSSINIPSGRYTIQTLNKKIQEENKKCNLTDEELKDGIVYTIIDNNTGITLYNDVYLFGENKKDFISELREIKYSNTSNKLEKMNLQVILSYYDNELMESSEKDGI